MGIQESSLREADPPTQKEFIPGVTFHRQSITYLLEECTPLHQHLQEECRPLHQHRTGQEAIKPQEGEDPEQQPPEDDPQAPSDPTECGRDLQEQEATQRQEGGLAGGDGQVAVAAASHAPSYGYAGQANGLPQGADPPPLDIFTPRQG